MKKIIISACAAASLTSLLSAQITSRTSFDGDWKFARFGKMADGTVLPEPGAKPSLISASSTQLGNPAANAIDGDPDTRWCASDESASQWLRLDLGREVKLSGVGVIWEKATKNTFAIAVSRDGAAWKPVVRKQRQGSETQRLKFPTTARYIKLQMDGSGGAWASVRELIALDSNDKPVKPQSPADSDAPASPDQVAFDDSRWRSLDLPHDWAIEGPFSMEIENETGKLPWEGIGWYRKTFDVPAAAAGRNIYIDFDGAMSHARVYINGTFAGEWAYGYNSFRIDATPHLKFGGKNTIAVRLENKPVSTRWYPGAGIYRHVWIVDAPKTHIAHWGTYVTTPEITGEKGTVTVETTLENRAGHTLRYEILDGEKVVASKELAAEDVSKATLTVEDPKRWDIKTPHRYVLRTSVMEEGKVIDQDLTRFGIRTIEWHPQNGFLLNGKRVTLKGVCNHHDLGPLGAAVNTRGMQRQIELLQEMGCNSIRTAHNPPAPEFLDLCDKMGVLVIDELFDIWKLQKYGKVNGYNIDWDKWHEKDVRNFILRDRNHPSIIAWSTGNEIPELGSPDHHWVSSTLTRLIKRYDKTRPVTAGSNAPGAATNGFAKTVDAYGVNYHLHSYEQVDRVLSNMAVYASETSSTVSTRGEYFFPVSWDKGKGFYRFQVSSYDLYAPGWANRPDLQFEMLDKYPRFAGEYVWTGFDYIGEPTPYNQDQSNALNFQNPEERKKYMEQLKKLGNRAPSRSSYFGILDLCGFKKDRFYLYQARWRPELPMAHILPHWNWPERRGKVTPVHVYTSGDEAELFLNGRSLGKRQKGKPHHYRLTWDDVKYASGKLEVVVSKNGKPWAKATKETTGAAKKLELTADRAEIAADGRDLSYLTIRVLDARGREVPRTRLPVHVRVSGPIEIAAIGNGDPTDHTTMKPADPTRAEITAFNGLAQIIVRSKKGEQGKGKIEIIAKRFEKVATMVTTIDNKHDH
ncbi:MAG: discoidin domain-containing protein [Akkermansiaceae bacterium]|nr:discoidin domain-containing protein [Akkermansiaceae bacterium]